MDHVNMLTAQKQKLHGMASVKWTTKDKITQYKGLVNLYTRDRQIITTDQSVARKRQYRELKIMQKLIVAERVLLDNAIGGDRQQMRNKLSIHRSLQLAYQNSPPKKVLDNLEHVNFKKRKELDRLANTLKLRSQLLVDLKLEAAELEDRMKYEVHDQTPVEKQSQIVAGKVQDAFLKKEAALAIKQTYGQIIAIMKKDALYFDAILQSIYNDGVSQSKCLLNATKLGQLATEYLDDRRMEYQELQEVVIKDMQARKSDLKLVHQRVENVQNNFKQLIRRDSDLNLCMVKLEETPSLLELQEDIRKIESTLTYIKDQTLVSTFEKIYPCLQEQKRQRIRLETLVQKCELDRDEMRKRTDLAQCKLALLHNTMVHGTMDYKRAKEKLITDMTAQEKRKHDIDELITTRNQLTARVRLSLRQLLQIVRSIKLPNENLPDGTGEDDDPRKQFLLGEEKLKAPEDDETDGCKMIPLIVKKLLYLMQNGLKFEDSKVDSAYKYFENMMSIRTHIKPMEDKGITEESLLEGMSLEVSHILTREDIKKQSDQIVEANSKNDDMVPLFVTKKKRFKFK